MSDGDFLQRRERGATVRALATWCGAAMSMALVGGLAFWGWQLLVRDVSGVPVVRAMEGPMRIAPATPGGEEAEHQGLTVNRVAARVGEGEPAPEVRLAPAVIRLAPDDLPTAAPEGPEPQVQPRRTPPAMRATDVAVAQALGLDPAAMLTLASATASEASRPEPRPEDDEAGRPVAALQPAGAAGGELIQLGAFEAEGMARSEWARLSERFQDVLEGHAGVVERVDRGGKSFWRLRVAAFEDLADARRVCSVLNAGGADCIPVVRR